MKLKFYMPVHDSYTEKDVLFIKMHYPQKGSKWVAKELGKTCGQIKGYVTNHKIHRDNYKISNQSVQFIRQNVYTLAIEEIAVHIGETKRRVKDYIYRNRLKPCTYLPYSDEEIRFIKDNFHHLSNIEIASKLGRSPDSIHAKIPQLKLKRTEEDLLNFKNRFAASTMFQKGNLPENTKYDGYISIRKDSNGISYKHIRISRGKFELLHRYNWMNKYGPVPEGMVLRAIDGNQLNCEPDNWKLINRADHLEENAGRKELTDKYIVNNLSRGDPELKEQLRLIPELIEVKRNQLKLRRTIHELTQTSANG